MILSDFSNMRRIFKITEEQYRDILYDMSYDLSFNKIKDKESIITEKWSISDEVTDALEYVYQVIDNTKNNSKRVKAGKNVFKLINTVPIKLFGTDIKLTYNILMISGLIGDDADITPINSFNQNAMTLEVTIYMYVNTIIDYMSNANIRHELEHLYQYIKNKENNTVFNSLINGAYSLALHHIDNSEINSASYHIANIFYMSNYREQDSFVNELYEEMQSESTMADNPEETNVYEYRRNYWDSIKYYYNNKNTHEVINALCEYKKYGYSTKNFELMITKAVKRFDKKINNVLKIFKETHPLLKNHISERKIRTIIERFKSS